MERDSTVWSGHHRIQNGRQISVQYTYSSPLRFGTMTHGSSSSRTVNSEIHQEREWHSLKQYRPHYARKRATPNQRPKAKKNLGNAMPFDIQTATDKLNRKKRRARIATKHGWAKTHQILATTQALSRLEPRLRRTLAYLNRAPASSRCQGELLSELQLWPTPQDCGNSWLMIERWSRQDSGCDNGRRVIIGERGSGS